MIAQLTQEMKTIVTLLANRGTFLILTCFSSNCMQKRLDVLQEGTVDCLIFLLICIVIKGQSEPIKIDQGPSGPIRAYQGSAKDQTRGLLSVLRF